MNGPEIILKGEEGTRRIPTPSFRAADIGYTQQVVGTGWENVRDAILVPLFLEQKREENGQLLSDQEIREKLNQLMRDAKRMETITKSTRELPFKDIDSLIVEYKKQAQVISEEEESLSIMIKKEREFIERLNQIFQALAPEEMGPRAIGLHRLAREAKQRELNLIEIQEHEASMIFKEIQKARAIIAQQIKFSLLSTEEYEEIKGLEKSSKAANNSLIKASNSFSNIRHRALSPQEINTLSDDELKHHLESARQYTKAVENVIAFKSKAAKIKLDLETLLTQVIPSEIAGSITHLEAGIKMGQLSIKERLEAISGLNQQQKEVLISL